MPVNSNRYARNGFFTGLAAVPLMAIIVALRGAGEMARGSLYLHLTGLIYSMPVSTFTVPFIEVSPSMGRTGAIIVALFGWLVVGLLGAGCGVVVARIQTRKNPT